MIANENRVEHYEHCRLVARPGEWPFAHAHAAEIDRHWERRRAASPAMFNGTVHLLVHGDVQGTAYRGTLLAIEFKSFLYWKDQGYPDRSVRDVFGSALLYSCEGHVLLGRQGPGQLNAGLAYLPGGFIDQRDVAANGQIDIEASVAREIVEETGLDPSALERLPGFLATHAGPMLSIAVAFRSPLTSAELKSRMLAHIASQAEPELGGIVVIRSSRDLQGLGMPIYARVLLAHLFPDD